MQSLLENQIEDFNKKISSSNIRYKIFKQIGAFSWELDDVNAVPITEKESRDKRDKDSEKEKESNEKQIQKYVITTKPLSEENIKFAYEIYRKLIATDEKAKENFLKYLKFSTESVYSFTILEYCNSRDLNSYLIEFRYKSKSNSEEQALRWLSQLVEAVAFLDKNKFIHTKLNTYVIFVHNDKLKINGLEYLEPINGPKKIEQDNKYGMFNCPEIYELKKINKKYHIWCLGVIFYEIATCEWQHFKLLNEDFKDWLPPNLPSNFSNKINNSYKKMLRIEPKSRPSTEKLIASINNLTKDISKKKQSSDPQASSSSSFLTSFLDRFAKKENEDEDANVSESEDDSREELKIYEDLPRKNYNNYKLKARIVKGAFYEEYLVYSPSDKKRKNLREFLKNDSSDKSLSDIENIRETIGNNCVYLVKHYEAFITPDTKNLCILTEYFEEGTLDRTINRFKKLNRQFSEDKIFDYVYYLLEALNYLHSKKIFHRDIATKNIYVRNERIKLGNFGIEPFLSQAIDKVRNSTDTKAPCYFSPEVIDKKTFTHASDIWAVGCVLFEMYNFRHLFLNADIVRFYDKSSQVPELESSPRLKALFKSYTRIKDRERPTAHDAIKELNKIIDSERKMIELLER